MITVKNNNSDMVIKAFDDRKIEYAFHDIDGTHSLIRDWPPVMSICLYDVICNGLPEDFDSEENSKRLISLAGTMALPETDAFCVESAGLSALTQMEWAIRRSVQEGKISVECNQDTNAQIIERINNGEEYYDDLPETEQMNEMLRSQTPRLFKLYEAVLNGYCRDKNLLLAKENPEKFRVKGSYEFLKYLKANRVKNYFVTGAVVQKGMGMHEEVEALGYSIGKGELIEDIIGSTWTEKKPKDAVMKDLIKELHISAENVLVIGDGRAEIQAGVELGAIVISRLPENATYQRQLHKKLGTNLIVEDFSDKDFYSLFNEVE
jgi:phosphoglycolate phosphatase-like HAD superfamily hydrolase